MIRVDETMWCSELALEANKLLVAEYQRKARMKATAVDDASRFDLATIFQHHHVGARTSLTFDPVRISRLGSTFKRW